MQSPGSKFDQSSNQDSNESNGKIDMPYRVWFVIGVIATFSAIWNSNHYELLAKIAWTITAPGFTLSQTWRERHDLFSRAVFGILLLLHCFLMESLDPRLPHGHYGYILLTALAEIMSVGLAYQIWIHLRTKANEASAK